MAFRGPRLCGRGFGVYGPCEEGAVWILEGMLDVCIGRGHVIALTEGMMWVGMESWNHGSGQVAV